MKRRTAKHKRWQARKRRCIDFSQTLTVINMFFQSVFFLNMPCRVKIYLGSLFIIYACRHENRWFPAHADITAESHRVIKQHTGITLIFQLHRLFSDFLKKNKTKTVFISPKVNRLTMDCLNVFFLCYLVYCLSQPSGMVLESFQLSKDWSFGGFFVKRSHLDRINSGEKNNFFRKKKYLYTSPL